MASGLNEIIELEDPIGKVISEWERPKRSSYSKNICSNRSNWNNI